jgi:hypothetical protein
MLIYDYKQRPSSKEILDEFLAWLNRPLFSVFKAPDAEPAVEKIAKDESKA